MRIRRAFATLGIAAVVAAGLVAPARADADDPVDDRAERRTATDMSDEYDGKLDVLFVGAHPDDESGGLSTYGQWREQHDIATGVLTVTRGEGGGNAVGPEEGPALGLLREAEERRAVGMAGVTDVHNLDEVDFFYTVSQPLTREVWGHEQTLDKVVRVIRETRPSVIVTMDPAPSPGNHGNHQEAARLAVEAYQAAGDPERFPDQDVDAWQPKRLFLGGGDGTGPTGPACESDFEPNEPTADTYGVYSGREADNGKTWAQLEREAQREYASQGWAGFPDVPSDPDELECDRFTQVDSQVPYPLPGTPEAARPDAMLQGAAVRPDGGFGLDTRFELRTERFEVLPGEPFEVRAQVSGRDAENSPVELTAPTGWTVEPGDEGAFTVTPPADAEVGQRVRLTGTLGSEDGDDGPTGTTSEVVRVTSAVEATPELLPQVAEYEQWAADLGMPELGDAVSPVTALGSGERTKLRFDLHNASDQPSSGEVELRLPDGFEADDRTKPYPSIPAGETGQVTFTVSNTDEGLPTGNEGGDYPYTLRVRADDGQRSSVEGGLELTPTTTVEQADGAPTVDGVESDGEYPGEELELSRRWEGDACENAGDCSATGKVTWHDDALYVVAKVTDDTLGKKVERTDCKRHWRTDSVEIALDPGLPGSGSGGRSGRVPSENTATTFKAAIFPTTTDGQPCYARDADNRQGPGKSTAPGMKVASTVNEPYDGYTVEARIDLADLPAAVDPQRLGLNMFVYDSDTDDLTGQTRIGWSTWGGVQGDPYRWGVATMPGYEPPADRPDEPIDPEIPSDAARSVESPQSILQAAATGIPLAGAAPASPADGRLVGPVRLDDGEASGRVLATGPGTAYVFSWSDDGVVDRTKLTWDRPGVRDFTLAAEPGSVVVVGFQDEDGGTSADAQRVRPDGPVLFPARN